MTSVKLAAVKYTLPNSTLQGRIMHRTNPGAIPQAKQQTRSIAIKVAMEMEVLNKDKVKNDR